MHQRDPDERLGKIHVSTLFCATLLATLAVFAVNRTILGQIPRNNCSPSASYQPSSPQNTDVPCKAATCVVWSSAFGSNANQTCTEGPSTGKVVTKYSLTGVPDNWSVCGAPATSSGNPICTETIQACGNYAFYADSPAPSNNNNCLLGCGSSNTIGYCKSP